MTLDGPSGAIFSEDRVYRHILWRRWDTALPWVNLTMCNPSRAGATETDPTVTRQIERAKRLGCGGLLVTNAFDIVATDPRDMKRHQQPCSLENDRYVLEAANLAIESGGLVIAAWGSHAKHRGWDLQILDILNGIPLKAVAINDDGSPGHPLYVKYSVVPFDWPVG